MSQKFTITEVGLRVALEDFKKARRRAFFDRVTSMLTGRPDHLLPAEDIQRLLKSKGVTTRGLREIPLKSIVGSVGRYDDFTASFLPLNEADKERWMTVRAGIYELGGLPPIEVYQVGEVYFVIDGNHRVSVARKMGKKVIEAYVTEIATEVNLSPDDKPDELINKARYAEFLAQSQIHESRPEAELMTTATGNYRLMLQEIGRQCHQYEWKYKKVCHLPKAAATWYDDIYLPMIGVIRDQGILRDFPHRTETDLYVWLVKHQQRLEEKIGTTVPLGAAVSDLAEQKGTSTRRKLERMGEAIKETILPEEFTGSGESGLWRHERLETPQTRPQLVRFFREILVPVSDHDDDIQVVDLALKVARWEGGRIKGVLTLPANHDKTDVAIELMRERFMGQCADAGIPAQIFVDVGDFGKILAERARWIDLAAVSLAPWSGEPPPSKVFRRLVRRCTRPILAVPLRGKTEFRHALLAYDGGAAANEALYIATYLARQWQTKLTVLYISKDKKKFREVIKPAKEYLKSHGVRAEFIRKKGKVSKSVLAVRKEQDCDLIMMGSFLQGPALEFILGNPVNGVLEKTKVPVLICR